MKAFKRQFLLILALAVGCLAARAEGPVRLRTVVIDPGHGGNDPGCVSKDGLTTEKSLTLDISTRLSEKINAAWPDVKAILTREDDTYVTLSGRADAANNADADLFISIHINAAPSGTAANGYSIHCLGQSSRQGNDLFSKNLELCQRENSVIKLEADYETKYQGFDPSNPMSYIFFGLMQNANLSLSLAFADDVNNAMKGGPFRRSRGVSQDPFWVLWRTTMPAVLIECGFISNPEDLATLRTEEDRDKIAEAICQAIATYKKRLDASTSSATGASTSSATNPEGQQASHADTTQHNGEATTPPQPSSEQPPQVAEPGEAKPVETEPVELYGTQVLATSRKLADNDPFFQGYEPVAVQGEKLIRYVIGVSPDKAEAKKKNEKIAQNFPDSFLVKIVGKNTTRIP
ncbi:MAG: N-acetylmuramoyl-L-alanine amidase [Bacteroidales bacterium]|nr:N-acetylmuramoyl-L-alanine amidase [Bacteroidales bacterium]